MSFFDGTLRSRTISYNTKKIDRSALILQNKMDRIARESNKVREDSVNKIINVWRCYKLRRREREINMESFKMELKSIIEEIKNGKEERMKIEKVNNILILFYNITIKLIYKADRFCYKFIELVDYEKYLILLTYIILKINYKLLSSKWIFLIIEYYKLINKTTNNILSTILLLDYKNLNSNSYSMLINLWKVIILNNNNISSEILTYIIKIIFNNEKYNEKWNYLFNEILFLPLVFSNLDINITIANNLLSKIIPITYSNIKGSNSSNGLYLKPEFLENILWLILKSEHVELYGEFIGNLLSDIPFLYLDTKSSSTKTDPLSQFKLPSLIFELTKFQNFFLSCKPSNNSSIVIEPFPNIIETIEVVDVEMSTEVIVPQQLFMPVSTSAVDEVEEKTIAFKVETVLPTIYVSFNSFVGIAKLLTLTDNSITFVTLLFELVCNGDYFSPNNFGILNVFLISFKKYLNRATNLEFKFLDTKLLRKIVIALRELIFRFYWSNFIFTHSVNSTLLWSDIGIAAPKLWYKVGKNCTSTANILELEDFELLLRKQTKFRFGSPSDFCIFTPDFTPIFPSLSLPMFARTLSNPRSRSKELTDSYQSPAYRIVSNLPYMLPFALRVDYFYQLINQEKREASGAYWHQIPTTRIEIRREHIWEDALEELTGKDIKKRIQVEFTKDGRLEPGIDGGGLFKEFISSACQEGFSKGWILTNNQDFIPSDYKHHSGQYYFMGLFVGKCLYEQVLIQNRISISFLNSILGKTSTEDLELIDSALYKSLNKMKDEDVLTWELNFTVKEQDKLVELIPNGSNIPVTNRNKELFIELYIQYKLDLINKAKEEFLLGLEVVINLDWLKFFSADELQLLISGSSNIDVRDWRQNTVYNVFDANDLTIQYFWEVVEEMSDSMRSDLLLFATSCSRAPLLGFKALQPKFGINMSSNDDSALPTASTCFNLLKLPRYKSKETLKLKLIAAITSGAGFEMT